MSKLDTLQTITEETKKFQERMRAQAKTLLLEVSKELFETYPNLLAIHWTQYTPYFNDGEPCHFGVNEPDALIQNPEKLARYEAEKREHEDKQATIRGLSEEQRASLGVELEEWIDPDLESLADQVSLSSWSRRQEERIALYGELWKDLLKFSTWITDSVNEFTMESVFGDHVRVTLTKEGATMSEYDHE